jgi:hypothetical protein
MFVNELVPLRPENEAEIVEAHDDSFDLLTTDEFYGYVASISSNPMKKLILDIDLILDHHPLISSPPKRCHLAKDPLAVPRFLPPADLRVGLKPRPLPFCVAAGIPLDLSDGLVPFDLLL